MYVHSTSAKYNGELLKVHESKKVNGWHYIIMNFELSSIVDPPILTIINH